MNKPQKSDFRILNANMIDPDNHLCVNYKFSTYGGYWNEDQANKFIALVISGLSPYDAREAMVE